MYFCCPPSLYKSHDATPQIIQHSYIYILYNINTLPFVIYIRRIPYSYTRAYNFFSSLLLRL